MKNFKIISLLSVSLFISSFVFAGGMEDDPLVTKKMISIEVYKNSEDEIVSLQDVSMWAGYDLNKLWLKVALERLDGEIEEQKIQLLYGRAIAPYWDILIGGRKDLKPEDEQREWGVISLKGLAPYLFETDVSLFFGESGQSALKLQLEYEYMFSQQLVIAPEMELNVYAKDDLEIGIGKGLSDVGLGLRLRYEITREFAPYIGVEWSKKFGNTADISSEAGEEISETQAVIGLRFWF